jgi:hypothetical protein
MAVDEDAEAAWEDDHRRRSSSGDRGLPSRLAHLRGPSSTTPAASRAPPPARPTVQPTVRTASGKTLMGPWVGRFARADADLADAGGASSQLCDSDEEDFFIARSSSPIDVMDADPPTPESCARYTPRGAKRHSAAAFSFDAVDVDALTDADGSRRGDARADARRRHHRPRGGRRGRGREGPHPPGILPARDRG